MKMTAKQDPYRGVSERWDRLMPGAGQRAALEAFLPWIPPQSRVLDLGAGVGFDSLVLIGAGHQVTALDRSKEMLERLSTRAPKVTVLEKDARLWSPSEGVFEAAWANDFFPDLSVDEMHRVLGGLFRALVPGAPFGMVIRSGAGTVEEMPLGYDGPVRTLTLIDPLPMAAMLNQSGFEIKKEGSLIGNPSLRLMICKRI